MKAYTIRLIQDISDLKIDLSDFFYAKIDGSCCKTEEDLHNELSNALNLPEHYGRNLDALFDCLLDLEWIKKDKVLLHFENFEIILIEEKSKSYIPNALLLLISDLCASEDDPANKHSFNKKLYFLINYNPTTEAILKEADINYIL